MTTSDSLWSLSGCLRVLMALLLIPAVLLGAVAAIVVMPVALIVAGWPRRRVRLPGRAQRVHF